MRVIAYDMRDKSPAEYVLRILGDQGEMLLQGWMHGDQPEDLVKQIAAAVGCEPQVVRPAAIVRRDRPEVSARLVAPPVLHAVKTSEGFKQAFLF
jgi:hypothetical protein